MIDMNHKYQTRDGRAVEILRNNIKNKDFPVVGIITQPDGSEIQDRWTQNGGYFDDDNGEDPNISSSDLIPAPTKHEGWISIPYGSYPYPTREALEKAIREECHTYCEMVSAHVTWED